MSEVAELGDAPTAGDSALVLPGLEHTYFFQGFHQMAPAVLERCLRQVGPHCGRDVHTRACIHTHSQPDTLTHTYIRIHVYVRSDTQPVTHYMSLLVLLCATADVVCVFANGVPCYVQVDSLLHAWLSGTEIAGVGVEAFTPSAAAPEAAAELLSAAVTGLRTLPRRAASAYDRVAIAAVCRAAILSQLDRIDDAKACLTWIVDHDADIVGERYVPKPGHGGVATHGMSVAVRLSPHRLA